MGPDVAEPQHLCGKAPCCGGSYDLDRLCWSEKSRRIQKVVQRFGVRNNIEETAHLENTGTAVLEEGHDSERS